MDCIDIISRDTEFTSGNGPHPFFCSDSSPEEIVDFIQNNVKILVLGAGGLGCEILKDLALSGFKNIHVIDLDTIELTNLNRQFLFRNQDIGKYKAEVASQRIKERVSDVNIDYSTQKIQDLPKDFFKQFNCVIGGLDNIEARRYMNEVLCDFVSYDGEDIDISTIIPFIDGGTEGFKGQCNVIIPHMTPCFYCSEDLFPPTQNEAICTIANNPRKPAHCIEYAMLFEWPKQFPDRPYDTDSIEDMQWIHDRSIIRAVQFNIEEFDYSYTLGVVKHIIPAIASTNAIIAAAAVHEVYKLFSMQGHVINNYFMYMGNDGLYTDVTQLSKKDDCPVCKKLYVTYTIDYNMTLNDLVSKLLEDTNIYNDTRLSNPLLYNLSNDRILYNKDDDGPISDYLANKLPKKLSELGITDSPTYILISDKTLEKRNITLILKNINESNELEE